MEMRNTKKKSKCALACISMYDQQRIESKLTEMAKKGWMIEEMQNSMFWNYRRIEPKELRFAAVYSAAAFEVDADAAAAQREKDALCACDGWIPAASWGHTGNLRVYYNEQEDPVPIETDPVVWTEGVYAAMQKRWPVLLVSVFLLLSIIFRQIRSAAGSEIYTFSSPVLWLHLSCLAVNLLFAAYQILADMRWYKRAAVVARQGDFLPIMTGRLRDTWVNYILILLTLILVFATSF